MRQLFITNMYPPASIGGYELGCRDVVRQAEESGNSTLVLTSDFRIEDTKDESSENIQRSLILDSGNFPNPSMEVNARNQIVNLHNTRTISYHIANFKPDLIFCFNLHGLGVFSCLKLLEIVGIPCILYLMDDYFSDLHTSPDAYNYFVSVLGNLDLCRNFRTISMSKRLTGEIQSKIDMDFGDVTYVPGWAEAFDGQESNNKGPMGKEIKLLFVSTIEEHKGIFLALEALSHLPHDEIDRISLDVYGSGSTERLLKDIGRHELSSKVRYIGPRKKSEILRLYSNYHFLLFPTWAREPFGFVAAEAASNGCIPIITMGTGASEYLEDQRDAIFISRDVDGIIEGIRKALSIPLHEIERFRARCKISAAAKFNEHNLMKTIFGVGESLTSKPGRIVDPQKAAKALIIGLDSFY
jgi:glycogen(starch) synthase